MATRKANTKQTIQVVAAIMRRGEKILATQRGYGEYKDLWEFPGGKIETGENPEDALKCEIREELNVEIRVESFFQKIDYDYPSFHIAMDCYLCHINEGEPELLEHEDAKWLSKGDIDSVGWLPADAEIVEKIKSELYH